MKNQGREHKGRHSTRVIVGRKKVQCRKPLLDSRTSMVGRALLCFYESPAGSKERYRARPGRSFRRR